MASPLDKAVELVGLLPLAKALGRTYQAIRKWQRNGRMPRTEWTGETAYSEVIERLTGGRVTKEALLSPWPPGEPVSGKFLAAEALNN